MKTGSIASSHRRSSITPKSTAISASEPISYAYPLPCPVMSMYMQPIQSGEEMLTNKNQRTETTSFTFFIQALPTNLSSQFCLIFTRLQQDAHILSQASARCKPSVKPQKNFSLVRLLFHCTESLLQPDEDIPESLSGIVSSSIDCTLQGGLWPPDTFPVTAVKSHYFSA